MFQFTKIKDRYKNKQFALSFRQYGDNLSVVYITIGRFESKFPTYDVYQILKEIHCIDAEGRVDLALLQPRLLYFVNKLVILEQTTDECN